MNGQLSLKDLGGLFAVAISLGGLLWEQARQSSKVDDHDRRIVQIEQVQAVDHDALTAMKSRAGGDR